VSDPEPPPLKTSNFQHVQHSLFHVRRGNDMRSAELETSIMQALHNNLKHFWRNKALGSTGKLCTEAHFSQLTPARLKLNRRRQSKPEPFIVARILQYHDVDGASPLRGSH